MTAVRISAGEASEVTRNLHAAYSRERIEEVIRAVVEDALSPSRVDVLPWHDEVRFEDDLQRVDPRDRRRRPTASSRNGSPTCSSQRRPTLAGRLAAAPRFSDLG